MEHITNSDTSDTSDTSVPYILVVQENTKGTFVNPNSSHARTPQVYTFRPKAVASNLTDFLGGNNYNPEVDPVPYERAVAFFQGVLDYAEKILEIEHFRLDIAPIENDSSVPFEIRIFPASPSQLPPRKAPYCISCDSESIVAKTSSLPNPLEELGLRLPEDWKHLNKVWLDAQARPMYIVTPTRHVERLSHLTPPEIFTFFFTVSRLMHTEYSTALQNYIAKKPSKAMQPGNKDYSSNIYMRMTLNHGNSRNIEHLHLKVRIKKEPWNFIQMWGWDQKRKDSYEMLNGGLFKQDDRVHPSSRAKNKVNGDKANGDGNNS